MFGTLSHKLQDVFKRLRSRGKLTEGDVGAALREVRLALLEADVNFKVVKDFIARVQARAVGHEVLGSLTPGQQVIKLVYEELVDLLGGGLARLPVASNPPSVYVVAGLQGAGKTTTCAKLAYHLKKRGKRPLLAGTDVRRPAAMEQLTVMGGRAEVPVRTGAPGESPLDIACAALAACRQAGRDTLIVDTSGRLHVDDELMAELASLTQAVKPTATLLVVDAMTGQDAVNVAQAFMERAGLDGLILAKLDSDARGGAALSARAVTGKPVLFAGVGEGLPDLEEFHPDRMASRLLGMGDVLTLIERAQEAYTREQAEAMERKLKANAFTLSDFLEQLQQVRKLGPLDQLLGMLPAKAAPFKAMQGAKLDAGDVKRVEAIIRSMTAQERVKPEIIDGSRRRRIAAGSGTSVQEVNRLLKQFETMQVLMRQFAAPRRG
ncbi:MAG: signal recognition particle protein [Bacillota bacterium]